MSSNTTETDLSTLSESANILAGGAWLLMLFTGMAAIYPALRTVASGTRPAGMYHRLYNFMRTTTSKGRKGALTLTVPPLASSGFALLVWRMQWMHLSTLVGTLPDWMYRLSRGLGPINGILARLPWDAADDVPAHGFCPSGLEALAAFIPLNKHWLIVSALVTVAGLLLCLALLASLLAACAACRPSAKGWGVRFGSAVNEYGYSDTFDAADPSSYFESSSLSAEERRASAACTLCSSSSTSPESKSSRSSKTSRTSRTSRTSGDSDESVSPEFVSSSAFEASASEDASEDGDEYEYEYEEEEEAEAGETEAEAEEKGRKLGRYVEPDRVRPMHHGERLTAMLEGALARGFRLFRLTRDEVALGRAQALDTFGQRAVDFVFASVVRLLIAGYVGVTAVAAHALTFGSATDGGSDEAKLAFGLGLGVYVVYSLGLLAGAWVVLRRAHARSLFTYANVERSRFAARWGPLFNDYDALHAPYFVLVDLGRRLVLGTLVGVFTCKPDVLLVLLGVVHVAYAVVLWYERPHQVPSRFSMEGLFAVMDVVHLALLLPGSGLYAGVSTVRIERAAGVLLFAFCAETVAIVAYITVRIARSHAMIARARGRQHELAFVYDEIDIGGRGRAPSWRELWGVLCTSRPDDYFDAVHQPLYDGVADDAADDDYTYVFVSDSS